MCCCSVAHLSLTLFDPTDCFLLSFSVLHHLPKLAQTHAHGVVMPSNHLVFCHSLLLLSSTSPSIRVFGNESALPIRWPKCWRFRFNRNHLKCINWKRRNKCVFIYRQNDRLCRKVNGTYKRSFVINKFSMVSGYKDTLESALDCKIKPVYPKGNQSSIFIGRTDAEAEVSTLWPTDAKS